MVGQGTNLSRPTSLGSHTNRCAVLARQLAQRVVNAQNAVNVNVHRDLVHHDGEVDVFLSGQIRDLNGFRLILGINNHIHRIGVSVQLDTGALNLAIRRALVKQLPRLSIAVHPVIHCKPSCLGKDQALLFVVRNRNFTLLGRWGSPVLQCTHDRDHAWISRNLTLQGVLNHELQSHGDRNQGRHGSNPGHLVQRRERRFKNPRPRCVFRIR